MNNFAGTLARNRPPGLAWGRSSVPGLTGLLLPMTVLTASQGPVLWLRFGIVLLVTLGLQVLFAAVRKQPLDLSGIVAAGIIAMAAPEATPAYQLLLGVVFGVVIGEQVFGGRGRSFLHPAVVTLAFLTFSFVEQDFRTGPDFASWTLLRALTLLLVCGQASWRILVAAAGVLMLAAFLQGSPQWWAPLFEGSIVLVLLYLAADPVASAATNPGRWLYGALVGGLTALFSTVGPAFGAAVFAVLLGSIFAPLLDRIVIVVLVAWRERRHG